MEQPHKKSSANGQPIQPKDRISHQDYHTKGAIPPGSPPASENVPPTKSSLADSRKHRYPICLTFPWVFLGLGTTGTQIVQTLVSLIQDAVGFLPRGCRYLTIDAKPTYDYDHESHHVEIARDGAGTNSLNGRRIFYEHYQTIMQALDSNVGVLSKDVADLITPKKTARESTGFMVVAGSGGTSGGILDPTISLIHDLAQKRSIQDVITNVVLLGPGMPLRDSSRQPLPEQVRLIHKTYAENLRRIYGHMATEGTVREVRPDGTDFFVEAANRVTTLIKADYTNGKHDFSTTDAFIAMMGHSLFLFAMTEAGVHARERSCDHRFIGISGLPTNSITEGSS